MRERRPLPGRPSVPDETSQDLDESAPRKEDRRRRHLSGPKRGLIELVAILGLALVLALAIQAWVFKPYVVPTPSMEPTLEVGQRIGVNRFIYHFEDPQIGDIVVFHPSKGEAVCGVRPQSGEPCSEPPEGLPSENYAKRIVAGPGDTLSIHGGHPVVNEIIKGDEPYIYPCGSGGPCDMPRTITIPEGHYFVMGDNRGASSDSRAWGPIPRDWIVGKVFATYWPPNRWDFF